MYQTFIKISGNTEFGGSIMEGAATTSSVANTLALKYNAAKPYE
jgi:hypothetical protein